MPITYFRNILSCSLTYFLVLFVIGHPIKSTQHEGLGKRRELAFFFLVSRALLLLLLTLSKLSYVTKRGGAYFTLFFSFGRDLEKCVLQQWKFILNLSNKWLFRCQSNEINRFRKRARILTVNLLTPFIRPSVVSRLLKTRYQNLQGIRSNKV